ncbi:ABC transporter permease [Dictyobacter kobayashii]|uniref:ABC transporter permease n=1 Tax=Dictyobacter kobayashii TaxID=2014872 RepID=A0A402AVH9_9CHLR|nr:hypothetical protein [Dictyobacter kobayashii]GCE23097.1 ABC transporter permease [Dictyobacter kobayashii]
MTTIYPILSLMYADFLERIRRYSFFITIALAAIIVYWFLPPASASYVTLGLGNYRGEYNSAWIGTAVALFTSTLLLLPAFFLVKNTVERDQQTGVGQILATTPLKKFAYTFGKFLSNFACLLVMIGVMFVTAIIMQLVRMEDKQLDIWALLQPFLTISLPAMAVVAALAIFFEVIPRLRGGLGNILYFILWIVMSIIFLNARPSFDLYGISPTLSSMESTLQQVDPGYVRGHFTIGIRPIKGHVQLFHWNGVPWNAVLLTERLVWILIAIGIALLASIFFTRFDPAREKTREYSKRQEKQEAQAALIETPAEVTPAPSFTPVTLTPITERGKLPSINRLFIAEVHLLCKGLPLWWYIIAAGLWLAGLLVPLTLAQGIFLPLAWIWPLLIWSGLGNRESRYNTGQIVFSTVRPLTYQLPVTWLTGIMITLLTGSGVGIHLLYSGQWSACLAWLTGVLFIPSLALALGCASGTTKLFEIIYLLIWYFGGLSHIAQLDFMGATSASISAGIPGYYLIAVIPLLALAFLGRRRQLYI